MALKPHELRTLSVQELKKRLSDEEENLANLHFQLATSQLESPISVRTVRRDIARLQTIIAEKERSEPAPVPPAAAAQPEKTEGTKA